MIQKETLLKVADNTGAKTVKCIGFVDTQKNASIGDCIIVSVRSLTPSSKTGPVKTTIKKGQIFKALIIRTKSGIVHRKSGHKIFFSSNDVVLINTQGNLVGSRIFGPITRELRAKNFQKILSYSDRIL